MKGQREPAPRPHQLRTVKSSVQPTSVPMIQAVALDLGNFDSFCTHTWVVSTMQEYRDRYSVLAEHARLRIVNDLLTLNASYFEQNGRVAFTDIQGRVKAESSLLLKLYERCREEVSSKGLTQRTIQA